MTRPPPVPPSRRPSTVAGVRVLAGVGLLALSGALPALPAPTALARAQGVALATAARVSAAASCPAAGGAVIPAAPAPATAGIVLSGHGWGHGLGMSQYGAQGAARLGCAHPRILATYYPGTHLAVRAMNGPVLLDLGTAATRSTVQAQGGSLTWRTSSGVGAVEPGGGTWTVAARARGTTPGAALLDQSGALRLWVAAGDRLTVGDGGQVARVTSFEGSTVLADLRVRYDRTLFAAGSGTFAVRQYLGSDARGSAVQKYLWGLAEVPVTWPQEALRAQADAARTYLAQSWDAGDGAYLIGVSTAAQVYAGASREDEDARYGGGWRAAVQATAGELVVDAAGAPIWSMYASSDGGWSESRAYVYGSQGGFGYLRAVDDSRWDLASDNPRRSWSVTYSAARLAALLGFDSVTAVTIAGPGTPGRADGLHVTGSRHGAVVAETFTGSQARWLLALPSPGFDVDWSAAGRPPGGAAPAVQPLVGDWDGAGRDEIGTWHNGVVRLRMHDGTVVSFRYGFAGGRAVVGDWNGDGRDSIGIFAAGRWYLRNSLSAGPADLVLAYGRAGDLPLVGRWPGMSAGLGLGVVRAGHWYLRRSLSTGAADVVVAFGQPGDVPEPGDWTGAGVSTVGVARGVVFLLGDALAPAHLTRVPFGLAGDVPVVGDWDGVHGDTPAVFRPSTSTWYWRNDLAGGVATASAVLGG